MMDVELLVVPNCPHADAADDLLRRALVDIGLSAAAVSTRIVDSAEDAQAAGFMGSPTFRVGSVDLFPVEGVPRLACRLYEADGASSGLPTMRDLRQALKRAAAANLVGR